jgi:CTP-dependent riboflavin kinase
MWDHVENVHRLELAAFATGRKPCPICGARGIIFTPSDVLHFKSHIEIVHKIKLRP